MFSTASWVRSFKFSFVGWPDLEKSAASDMEGMRFTVFLAEVYNLWSEAWGGYQGKWLVLREILWEKMREERHSRRNLHQVARFW